MERLKTLACCVVTSLFVAFLPGKSLGLGFSGEAAVLNQNCGTKLTESSITDGADGVNVRSQFQFRFSSPIDTKKNSPASYIKIENLATGLEIPFRISVTGDKLKISPNGQFFFNPAGREWDQVNWNGIKPSTPYRISLSSGLAFAGGKTLCKQIQIQYSTKDRDEGMVWFNSTGGFISNPSPEDLEYFDPSLPTVLYVHGWQNNSSPEGFRKENPFFYGSLNRYGSENLLPIWKSKGYNVGIYYWSQWADESDVRNAEKKIWISSQKEPSAIRYRLRDGSYRNELAAKNIVEKFTEKYVQQFKNHQGGRIHLIGHSLGTQVAVGALAKIHGVYEAGSVTLAAVPKRITLLDPFWSKGAKDYLNNQSPGEKSEKLLSELVTDNHVIVDQVMTSLIGTSIIGDDNFAIRKLGTFVRLYPDFLPITDTIYQHIYAYVWFAKSILSPMLTTEKGALGAAASDDDLSFTSNLGKSIFYRWEAKQKATDPFAVTFKKEQGINNW